MLHALVLPTATWLCDWTETMVGWLVPLCAVFCALMIPVSALVVTVVGKTQRVSRVLPRFARVYRLTVLPAHVLLTAYLAAIASGAVESPVFPPGTCSYTTSRIMADSPIFPGATAALVGAVDTGKLKYPGILWADASDDETFLAKNNATWDTLPPVPGQHTVCKIYMASLPTSTPVAISTDVRNECLIAQSAYRARARSSQNSGEAARRSLAVRANSRFFRAIVVRGINSFLCRTIPDAACTGDYSTPVTLRLTPCQWIADRSRRAFGKSLGDRLTNEGELIGSSVSPEDTGDPSVLASVRNLNTRFVRAQLAEALRTTVYFAEQLVCNYAIKSPEKIWVSV